MAKLAVISFFGKPTIQIFSLGVFVGLSIGMLIHAVNRSDEDSYYFHNAPQDPKVYLDFTRRNSGNDTHHRMINTSLADDLFEKVKVLCWVVTCPANHLKKAIHIKATWGRRCNKLVFMSTEEDPVLPSVALPVTENRANLWGKTKQAMKYIYRHYYGQYDWFFKADDDTYVVMENLRQMLYYANSSDPYYYGCRLKYRAGNLDYMSGGAGYVLSKEALRRFVEEALPNEAICKQEYIGDEDIEVGKCLQAVGVKLGHSLDEENRNRFTPVFVTDMLIPNFLNNVEWYNQMMYNPQKQGLDCCSDSLISTHYVKPHQMYLLEYLIYHVTPFGRAYQPFLEKSVKEQDRKDHQNYHFGSTEKPVRWEDYY